MLCCETYHPACSYSNSFLVLTCQDEQRALFIDFVSKLLTIDPDVRPTAKEALKHPWILSSLDLTEDEIRYPPAD